MEIQDLTIREVNEITRLFGNNNSEFSQKNDIHARYTGKYVIVRSRNEGVNFGKVVQCDETGIVIKEARRLYYHKPAESNVSWYEGVSLTGLHSDSKISPSVKEKFICEDYSITICNEKAIESLKNHPSNES